MRSTTTTGLVDYTTALIAWPLQEFMSEPELVRKGYGAKRLPFVRPYLWRPEDLVDYFRERRYPESTLSAFAKNLGIKSAPAAKTKPKVRK